MSFGDVSYLLGRAHGIIGNVLTKSQLSLLLSSKNLKELRAAFTQTQYNSVIGSLNFETQLEDVARKLKIDFAEMLVKFYNQTSSSVQKKIRLFSERYNAENLRIILQGIHVGMKQEDIIARIVPVADYTLEYYTKLLLMPLTKIISTQMDSKLQKELLKAYEEFETTGRFTPIESTIDQYIYATLPKVSRKYETYVNMKNILALSRCITLGIPAYRYMLPNKFIAKALKAHNVSEVLAMYNYQPYKAVFSKYIGQEDVPLHELEFAVERYLLKYWKKTFRYGTVFETDSLIGFFELKLAEVMDVIRIIVGVSAGFTESEIRENLLFYGIF
ncbi:MAG: V-type ATPase subunit [Candidatus Heimdallarchaeota archaeon]|nr:V-type ATPase subunit [Candidatus Heimdallarchaeota archaeon]